MYHILYDYEFLLQSKEELGKFSSTLNSVRTYIKREINNTSQTKIYFNSRDHYRAIIAFPTKNLDDSHLSVLPFLLIFFKGTETDFYGETDNNEAFIQNLNEDSLALSYEQKSAIAGAIEIIEKKGELDPAWIVLLLEALGVGVDIVNKAP